MLDAAELVTVIMLAVILHELGHFVVAYWLGFAITTVVIGNPDTKHILRWQWRGITFRVHWLIDEGHVRVAWMNRKRWKNLAMLAAGPAANFMAVPLMWRLWYFFAVTNLLFGLFALLPLPRHDGKHLLREWRIPTISWRRMFL